MECYLTKFELETFSYSVDARTQTEYREVFERLKALNKPVIIVITQREGAQLSLAREHVLYFRMNIVGGQLQLVSVEDNYVSGGHVWGDTAVVIHVSMANTYFFAGTVNATTNERLNAQFLESFLQIIGVPDLDVRAVVLAGGAKDLEWACNPNSLRGSRSSGKIRSSDKVSRICDLAGNQFDELVRGFRKTCSSVELIVVGCGSKDNFVPLNPTTVAQRNLKPVDNSTPLSEVDESFFEGMVAHFMSFLHGVRERHRNPVPKERPALWTSSPMGPGAHQFFLNNGALSAGYREAYTMEVCNATLRGYGYRYLGSEDFPEVALRACAGQFQYRINPTRLRGADHTSVCCIPPTLPHQHSGVPCLLEHPRFRGVMDRNLIQKAEVSPCYVSSFLVFLLFYYLAICMLIILFIRFSGVWDESEDHRVPAVLPLGLGGAPESWRRARWMARRWWTQRRRAVPASRNFRRIPLNFLPVFYANFPM